MKLIFYLIISCISIFVASYIIPGIDIQNITTLFVLAVVLGILNTFLKPILILLTLPITLVTLGLFIFILNALIILFASFIVPGFFVNGFFSALLFSIVVSIVNWFLSLFLSPGKI